MPAATTRTSPKTPITDAPIGEVEETSFRILRGPTRGQAGGLVVLALVALTLAPRTPNGVGAAILLVGLIITVARSIPDRPRWANVLFAAASAPALALPLRTHEPLVLLLVASTVGLLVVAATSVHGPPAWVLGPMRMMLRGIEFLYNLMSFPAFFGPLIRRKQAVTSVPRPRYAAILRGCVLAVPLTWIVAQLLAADQVFAAAVSLSLPDNLWLDIGRRVAVAAMIACLAAGLIRSAASACLEDAVVPRWLGIPEAVTVLVPLTGVFALFVGTQVYAATGGADAILAEAGVTYAEYAREGFFQLLAVAFITLAVLATVLGTVHLTGQGALPPLVRLVSLAATTGVLLVVASAVRRLSLYAAVFGLTQLRLWAMVGAVTIGCAFVLLGIRVVRFRSQETWLLPALGALVVAVGLVVTIVSPDALIAQTNIERGNGNIDLEYLQYLSEDATPTIVGAIEDGRIAGVVVQELVERLCRRAADLPAGPVDYNVGRHRANAALERLCG